MIKKLRQFLFGINDWTTVWEDTEEVECYRTEELWSDDLEWFWAICKYRIEFSPTRKKCRLRCSGIGWKETTTYKKALELFDYYKNRLE